MAIKLDPESPLLKQLQLEIALMEQIHNRLPRAETLAALVSVVARVIYYTSLYTSADDRGRALGPLERQFVEQLHESIAERDHEPEYHDPSKPTMESPGL